MRMRCEYDASSTLETTMSPIPLRTRSRAAEGSPNHLCSLTPICDHTASVWWLAILPSAAPWRSINFAAPMSKRAFGKKKKDMAFGCVRKVDPFWSSAVLCLHCVILVD